jgi:hypothetical protein
LRRACGFLLQLRAAEGAAAAGQACTSTQHNFPFEQFNNKDNARTSTLSYCIICCILQIRAELAEKELAVLQKEQELLDKHFLKQNKVDFAEQTIKTYRK